MAPFRSLLVGFLLCALSPRPSTAAENPVCQIQTIDYRGWRAQQLSNTWVKLIFVPQNGGRLMQVIFGGHSYLFVNPQYAGKYLPPMPGRWFNYGGDKLWPLPEGTQDEQHWAGGSDMLDDGPYSFQTASEARQCRITLTGPADPRTGLQFMRTISLNSDSPQIHFHAVMKNSSGHPIEWSIQSVSQYDTADPGSASQHNRDFRAFTPANTRSQYLERYHVRFGPAENPFVEVREDGLFALRYGYLAAELWLDSTAGWLAVVDGATEYAMVERFHYRPELQYPGKASVIFWTNGPELHIDSHDIPSIAAANHDETPFYMEAELNSPLVRLAPGESYAFETDWFPARCGKEFVNATDAGLVTQALTASRDEHGDIKLRGSVGVFFSGRLVAHLYGRGGRLLDTVVLTPADPLKRVSIEKTVKNAREVARLSIHLEDSNEADLGSFGEVPVRPFEP